MLSTCNTVFILNIIRFLNQKIMTILYFINLFKCYFNQLMVSLQITRLVCTTIYYLIKMDSHQAPAQNNEIKILIRVSLIFE